MDEKQENISIEVSYYDDKEKEKFSNYPKSELISKVVKSGIEVKTSKFLTYYYFGRKRANVSGYRNFEEISLKVDQAARDMDGFVASNGESIYVPEKVGESPKDITERLGEAIGLSVVNQIYGLTEADWDRIPAEQGTGAHPKFDFGYDVRAGASEHIVQV